MNALDHLNLESKPIPKSLEELERSYNTYEGCRVELPSPPWYLRPTYRPILDCTDGMYLILIENKPPSFLDWSRYVIYSTADGANREGKSVWDWELSKLIKADDKQRERLCE